METTLIKVMDYCQYSKTEITFIQSLEEHDLIHFTIQENEPYIDEEDLKNLEKFAEWHYELEVNTPGIQIAHQLLQRMDEMQQELKILRQFVKNIE